MKPILFNTEMVQAILRGRKTVTRRLIKGLGNSWHIDKLLGDWALSEKPYIEGGILRWELQTDVDDSKVFKINLPFQVGDILYVRETWGRYPVFNGVSHAYKADYIDDVNLKKATELVKKWKPSIHMPKSLARIFLKVTNVRVEKIKDITEEEAAKEGFISTAKPTDNRSDYTGLYAYDEFMSTMREIYPESTKESWVWVIEFEILRRDS